MVVNDLLAASGAGRWIVLLPALVVGIGLIAGIFVLLGRAFLETVRESGHPRWFVAGAVALVVVVLLLTYLGIDLPREGGGF